MIFVLIRPAFFSSNTNIIFIFGLSRATFLSDYKIANIWSNQNSLLNFFSLYKIDKNKHYWIYPTLIMLESMAHITMFVIMCKTSEMCEKTVEKIIACNNTYSWLA